MSNIYHYIIIQNIIFFHCLNNPLWFVYVFLPLPPPAPSTPLKFSQSCVSAGSPIFPLLSTCSHCPGSGLPSLSLGLFPQTLHRSSHVSSPPSLIHLTSTVRLICQPLRCNLRQLPWLSTAHRMSGSIIWHSVLFSPNSCSWPVILNVVPSVCMYTHTHTHTHTHTPSYPSPAMSCEYIYIYFKTEDGRREVPSTEEKYKVYLLEWAV